MWISYFSCHNTQLTIVFHHQQLQRDSLVKSIFCNFREIGKNFRSWLNGKGKTVTTRQKCATTEIPISHNKNSNQSQNKCKSATIEIRISINRNPSHTIFHLSKFYRSHLKPLLHVNIVRRAFVWFSRSNKEKIIVGNNGKMGFWEKAILRGTFNFLISLPCCLLPDQAFCPKSLLRNCQFRENNVFPFF